MSAAKAHRYLVSFQRLAWWCRTHAAATTWARPPCTWASLQRLDPVRLARERLPALQAQIPHTLALAVWGNRGPTLVHWEPSPRLWWPICAWAM
jgi:DNA-binding IclR family transcriptional regulator